MAKEIDFPPVWLAGFAALGGAIGRFLPIVTPVNDGLGALLIVVALVLMIVAAAQMMLARTSVIPRRDPDALVQGGVFRFSRNPIYLADAILLAGLLFAWDALVALPLVAIFVVVIQRRFILDEEARLSRRFGEDYLDYTARVRRWL
ncbi:methyltransferase family protein [Albidovulum sp.]|jgi:protein-S-isoprenylcysteine O-methyltransferase Ste14|uniref:methyltransferase family protein n=1 Tax=Albidovulum sp. TaxID=1872424 RepID=UPI0030721654